VARLLVALCTFVEQKISNWVNSGFPDIEPIDISLANRFAGDDTPMAPPPNVVEFDRGFVGEDAPSRESSLQEGTGVSNSGFLGNFGSLFARRVAR